MANLPRCYSPARGGRSAATGRTLHHAARRATGRHTGRHTGRRARHKAIVGGLMPRWWLQRPVCGNLCIMLSACRRACAWIATVRVWMPSEGPTLPRAERHSDGRMLPDWCSGRDAGRRAPRARAGSEATPDPARKARPRRARFPHRVPGRQQTDGRGTLSTRERGREGIHSRTVAGVDNARRQAECMMQRWRGFGRWSHHRGGQCADKSALCRARRPVCRPVCRPVARRAA